MSLLVAGGEVAGRRGDLRVAGGRIAEVAPSLVRRPGERTIDARGQVVLPGLHDHHLHLRALAAARASVVAGPPGVTDRAGLFAGLRRAARAALAGGGTGGTGRPGWVRAVGYHESVAGEIDRSLLDAAVDRVPVRLQHRSGAMWVVNSAGVAALGLDAVRMPGVERDSRDHPTGRLFRMDAWLAGRVPPVPLDLASTSASLATRGVTGFTEATPGAVADDVREIVAAVDDGRIVQRVHVMCPPDVGAWDHPLVTRGPHKVVLDDATLPSPGDLAAVVRASHDAGAPVAVHCVTLVQLVVALEALGSVPPFRGDRIEHAAVVPLPLVASIRRLGATVVTNPSFIAERGDAYLADVDPVDVPDLYRCASLRRAGVPVAAGTDAPFAAADPWAAVLAAITRCTPSGRRMGADEAVDPETALALFTGHAHAPASPRRLQAGQPADLCVRRPTEPAVRWTGGVGPQPADRDEAAVTATVVAGRLVHHVG